MRFLVLISLLMCGSVLWAQPQPEHSKRMFQDSDGKIYTHPSLPAYFFMSSDPEGKTSVPMKSEAQPERTNPMYFDGPGIHHFRHSDVVEKVEINFLVYADDKVPVSKIDVGSAPASRQGEKRFFGQKMTATLSATDDMAGLDKIMHSVDEADYSAYEGPVTFDQEKEYVYQYYALDRVGNVEAVHREVFTVDRSSPKTTLMIIGDQVEDILSPRASLSLSAEDALSGVKTIYWKMDDGPEAAYKGSVALTGIEQGDHTFSYYAVDQVGNREEIHSYSFFLDSAPPIVAEDIIGDRYEVNGREYASGRTKVRLTAIDNKAGVKAIYYKINDGEYQQYQESFYLPNRQGVAELKAYAVDNANNSNKRDNEGRSIRVTYVDLSGPMLKYKFDGPSFKTRDTVFIGPGTRIQLSATDDESGLNRITYKVNGEQEEQAFSAPFNLIQEGIYEVEFYGYDNVNNRNLQRFSFRTDGTGPEVYPRFSVGAVGEKSVEGHSVKAYPEYVVVFLAATDQLVGYDKMYYSINGGEEKLYASPVSGFKGGETYTLRIRGIDKLGNEGSAEVTFVTVKSEGSE